MKAKTDIRERRMALGAAMFVAFIVLLTVSGSIGMTKMSKRRKAEQEREKLLHNMGERVKELRCMYGVATSIKKRKTIEAVFRDVVSLIPPGWQYPEITRAKICVDGANYLSKPFEKTQWKQTSDIVVNGQRCGSIEVYYLKECPELDEGPFLKEERHLIESIGRTLSEAAERKQAEQDLKKAATYIDAMGDALIVLNTQKQVIELNRAATELLGYSQDEMEELTFEKIFPKKEHEKHYAEMKVVVETGTTRAFETAVLTKSKKEIPVMFSGSITRDIKGIVSFLGVCRDITAHKQAEKDLKEAHLKLVESSRLAGMAEVAADVLHNVGNVLNSINVSTTVIREKITNSEVANLEKVASIINEHTDDLGTFLTEDPQGKHIPVYLTEVSKCLQSEQTDIISKLWGLAENVQHIKDIVSMQQSYAKVSGVEVQTSLSKLAEDAIRINSAGLERHGTRLIRKFEDLGDVEIDKQKALQILVNLISNAKYALSDSNKEEKSLTIRIYKHCEDRFRIEVADNGVGISEDNLTRIFSHGFTTKKGGHGFGLHSSALASKEMGGSLTVHSDGVGKGATFTLELPFKPVEVMK
jgi:PAS domain S-box-containing protein